MTPEEALLYVDSYADPKRDSHSAVLITLAAEVRRQHAQIEYMRQTTTGRVSAELHEAALAEKDAEIERLRANAERYRWLRDSSTPYSLFVTNKYVQPFYGADLDAAIDSARSKT